MSNTLQKNTFLQRTFSDIKNVYYYTNVHKRFPDIVVQFFQTKLNACKKSN